MHFEAGDSAALRASPRNGRDPSLASCASCACHVQVHRHGRLRRICASRCEEDVDRGRAGCVRERALCICVLSAALCPLSLPERDVHCVRLAFGRLGKLRLVDVRAALCELSAACFGLRAFVGCPREIGDPCVRDTQTQRARLRWATPPPRRRRPSTTATEGWKESNASAELKVQIVAAPFRASYAPNDARSWAAPEAPHRHDPSAPPPAVPDPASPYGANYAAFEAARTAPRRRYLFPATTAQEIGWLRRRAGHAAQPCNRGSSAARRMGGATRGRLSRRPQGCEEPAVGRPAPAAGARIDNLVR